MENTGLAMSQQPVMWANNYVFQTIKYELWMRYTCGILDKYVGSLIRILWITYFPGTTEL